MPDFTTMSLPVTLTVFLIAAVIIGVVGSKLAHIADVLADLTGMGEAIAGALFLGASTSLPGIVTSVVAAMDGHPELAISNAIGGIAAQTVFLAIADIVYTRANLEHVAASVANMIQATLLIVLLTLPILAMTTPPIHFWNVHPATPLMFVTYIFGMRMVAFVRKQPMWQPHQTAETQQDEPEDHHGQAGMVALWVQFAVFTIILGIAGWTVARTGIAISQQTGLSETAVGSFLTAISTSLPELVTSVAAVRQGAQTLAVGGIIGGNAFDTLFAAVADIAYRNGSIYHAITPRQLFLIALTILLIGILLMGLIRRQERGIANIGFESFLILVIYVGAAFFLLTV
jgi:cation:H+ antiporter